MSLRARSLVAISVNCSSTGGEFFAEGVGVAVTTMPFGVGVSVGEVGTRVAVGVAVTTMTTGVCVGTEVTAVAEVGVSGGGTSAPPFWTHPTRKRLVRRRTFLADIDGVRFSVRYLSRAALLLRLDPLDIGDQ